MRRIIAVVVSVFFAAGVVCAVMAQEEADTSTGATAVSQDKEDAGGWSKMRERMKYHLKEKKDKGIGTMQMMMGSMMKKEMVATGDGGVIVLSGNKLLKYDKDLELLKEVELPMDMKGMHEKMEEMMKNCPMDMQESEGEEAVETEPQE